MDETEETETHLFEHLDLGSEPLEVLVILRLEVVYLALLRARRAAERRGAPRGRRGVVFVGAEQGRAVVEAVRRPIPAVSRGRERAARAVDGENGDGRTSETWSVASCRPAAFMRLSWGEGKAESASQLGRSTDSHTPAVCAPRRSRSDGERQTGQSACGHYEEV